MTRYIALLRGINVGGHRVKMDHLRALFEAFGVDDVSTFIASGNVVFTSEETDTDALGTGIEAHLEAELGYGVATFLRTTSRIVEISGLSWPDALEWPKGSDPDSGSHYVTFLRTPAGDDLRAELAALESDDDAFRYEGGEVHWLMRGKVSESALFGGALEKVMRNVPNTMRNMTSVRRMAAKFGP